MTAPAPTAVRAGRPRPWQPTAAHLRACLAAAPIVVALVWRRPDLLVLATPLAIVAVWSALTRPPVAPRLTDRLGNHILREGDATTWRGVVSVDADAGADLVVAATADHPHLDRRPATGAVTAAVASGTAEVTIGLRAMRWGRHETQPVRVRAVGPWGGFVWETTTRPEQITVLPVPGAFDADAAAAPASGLVGVHRSSRPGEGSEFAGIRAFHVGDRMRRVNWPRSLRAGSLHVNTSWADRDTHVVLLVDATADLGVSEGIGGRASSLDVTVRAAGAIAEHVTRRGDRVSLRLFAAGQTTSVPPGTGTAHLRRVLDVLAATPPVGQGPLASSTFDPRSITLPGDVLAIMLSPLVTPHALDRAVALGRHGVAVAVLDTLPDDLATGLDPSAALAWRIRLLDRERELRLVQQAGVAVVAWRGPGSLDQFLRDVARRATAPRLRVR